LIGFTDVAPVKCIFGASDAAKTVVLFGDSHADQWSTPLASLASARGWRLVTVLKASCAVSDIPSYSPRLRRDWPECAEWRARAIEEIRQLQPTMVIVSQYSSGYVRGPWSARGKHAVTHDAWEAGLRRTLSRLRETNASILLLRDSPSPGRNVGTCIARSRWRGLSESNCDTPRIDALDPAISPLERAVATSMGARFGDLSAQFCDDTTCPSMRSGILVYRDANHMTTAFAARQAANLEPMLEPMLEGTLMSQEAPRSSGLPRDSHPRAR
jgi:hypothetical protein